MPRIEEYASDPDDFDLPLDAPTPADKGKGPALLPQPDFPMGAEPTIPKALRLGYDGSMKPVEAAEFAGWQTIYPLYLDAKRPQQDGGRRVNKQTALQWPLAEQIAKAARMLGFESVYEPSKTHPSDWENPGRVKVQLKGDDRKPKNAVIRNKRILFTRICELLRPHQPQAPPATASNPHPLPPIHLRLPPNSPAISHGVLEDAIKGGGPLGALGGMFGGGADDDLAIEGGEEQKSKVSLEYEKQKKQQEAMAKKLKKVHVKRGRR